MSWTFLVHFCDMVHFSNISGIFPGNILYIFGKHPGHVWIMYGTYLGHIQYPPNIPKIQKKSGMLKKEKFCNGQKCTKLWICPEWEDY